MAFDFLIVGGGSAGCVLAHRLSAAGATVLLVEAGRDIPPGAVPADIRDTYPRSYYNPAYMWPGLEASLTAAGGSAPGPFPQARVMGGGSAVAGMVGLRGLPDDYDGWEAQGAAGWGWRAVLPYFRRIERDTDHAGALHGTDGRVPIRRFRSEEWPAFTHAVAAAAERRGYPLVDDLNAGSGDGFGPLPLTSTPTERVSSASAYLDAETRSRPNLTIHCDTTVTRLLLRGGRCVGAEARRGGGAVAFEAEHVVLCAGAIHSPAILLRSGVGPTDELRANGIAVELPLPGVGRNLQNHPVVYLATHLRPEARQSAALRAQFVAALRFSSGEAPEARSDMILLVLNKSSWHSLGEAVAGLGVGLYRPLSRGRVRLASADPGASPRVDFELLANPSDAARMVSGLRLAVELMQDVAVRPLRHELFTAAYSGTVRRLNRPGAASRVGTRLLAALLDGPDALRHAMIRYAVAGGEVDESAMSGEAWLAATVARRTFGMYHPAGTCRIGGDGDPAAVLDARCRVHGLEGLSVVDASVMPTIVRGTTNLPVMMIAERAADLLLGCGDPHGPSHEAD